MIAILTASGRFFGLTPEQFFRDARCWHQDCADARHVAMFLFRQQGLSYPIIAATLGLRDHTTVLYGVRKVERDHRLQAVAAAIGRWLADQQSRSSEVRDSSNAA